LSCGYPCGQRLEGVDGDITKEQVDAIMNAADSRLLAGSGARKVPSRMSARWESLFGRHIFKREGP
jgi:hypothetical protein